MGIQTVMVTGDNPLTAAAIASEAGVDDFLAQATPEDKLAYIRREQQGGRLIAMCGDGTNDAPALAQADVGVAMQTGTQAAREAGNMVDLDSDPTKLIEIVGIGKQLLMTRGSLTTFSIANDVAKYFAIIPALFVTTYPELGALNIMGLHSDKSAILSAVIFNALIIIALIPLALKGVAYRPVGAAALLRRNLVIYGLGGIVAPVHRHQDHRHLDLRLASGLRNKVMLEPNSPRHRAAGAVHAADRPRLSAGDHRHRASRPAVPGQRQSAVDAAGKPVGSALIGQNFAADKYFHRPAVGDPGAGPRPPRRLLEDDRRALQRRQFGRLQSRPDLAKAARPRQGRRRGQARRRRSGPIPADAVTTSASGLDPDISPENASRRSPRSPRRAVCRRTRCGSWSRPMSKAASSA